LISINFSKLRIKKHLLLWIVFFYDSLERILFFFLQIFKENKANNLLTFDIYVIDLAILLNFEVKKKLKQKKSLLLKQTYTTYM
jgi:hypothetical protein